MDELGFNKIAGAVLATALGYMLIKEASHFMVHTEMPQAPAYALAIPEAGGAVEEDKPLPFPQAEWVAAMDADRGARVFKKCTSCHNNENGGANATGPNLWNVVGAKAGTHAGFAYSNAMVTADKTWTFESLNNYLERPGRYISGTNMNFIGLKKPADRAAVIEYLRVAADNPVPRPEAAMIVVPAEELVIEVTPDGASQVPQPDVPTDAQ